MSQSQALQRAHRYLDQFCLNLQPQEHERTTKTSIEAAQALGVTVGQIAKTILFKAGDSYGLFVAAGDITIDSKKVRALLGGGKVRIARPEEVEQITGYQVGGVCPFDIDPDIPIFLDDSMKRFEIVYSAAGSSHSFLPITLDQLKLVTSGSIVDMQKDAN
ncbi:MAG: YbaK/EbsC family protein [Firmicutes bacterium]|nr:YbaK/EbsC family protein [Bacillota bacterium]